MNIGDETLNCMSAVSTCTCIHTIQEFFFSPDVENQQILSLKYTVITLRLRQNKRNKGFDIVVAGTSVKVLHVCFVALDLSFIVSLYGTTRQKNTIKAPWPARSKATTSGLDR